MNRTCSFPDPTPVPNLLIMALGCSHSGGCAGELDDRIGLSSGADFRLTVCCRHGRYVQSDNRSVPLGLRHFRKLRRTDYGEG